MPDTIKRIMLENLIPYIRKNKKIISLALSGILFSLIAYSLLPKTNPAKDEKTARKKIDNSSSENKIAKKIFSPSSEYSSDYNSENYFKKNNYETQNNTDELQISEEETANSLESIVDNTNNKTQPLETTIQQNNESQPSRIFAAGIDPLTGEQPAEPIVIRQSLTDVLWRIENETQITATSLTPADAIMLAYNIPLNRVFKLTTLVSLPNEKYDIIINLPQDEKNEKLNCHEVLQYSLENMFNIRCQWQTLPREVYVLTRLNNEQPIETGNEKPANPVYVEMSQD